MSTVGLKATHQIHLLRRGTPLLGGIVAPLGGDRHSMARLSQYRNRSFNIGRVDKEKISCPGRHNIDADVCASQEPRNRRNDPRNIILKRVQANRPEIADTFDGLRHGVRRSQH